MAVLPYATVEQLTAHPGVTVPAEPEQLLIRASRDVDRALLTAVYDDTDEDVLAALRDATLEQAAGILAGGDQGGLGAASAPTSFTIGRLSVQGAAPTAVTRTGALVDQAWLVLQAAGLTGGGPLEAW